MPSTKAFILLSLMMLNVLSISVLKDIKGMIDRIRHKNRSQINERPIIGVLGQPSTQPGYPPEKWNFIAASYIKYVEAAGARAVPIQWDLPQAELAKLMGSINGLLLPGGSNDVIDEKGHWTPYYYVNKFLIELAEQMNRNGSYFPVWGTCQGFQYLAVIYANDPKVLTTGFNDIALNHNQTFTVAAKSSRLFSGLSDDLRKIMETEPILYYYHNYGVEPSVFNSNPNLVHAFTVLSTAKTDTGREFIASFEHKTFPFYGVQFHPEKNQFEWMEDNGVNHSDEGVMVTQYLHNFFGVEARKNMNKFENPKEEYAALIYNYNPIQTNMTYSQSYFFNARSTTNTNTTKKNKRIKLISA